MSGEENKRGYWRGRFNVPWDDEIVLGFVETQDNIHASLRLLVHDFVEAHGMADRLGVPSQKVVDEQAKKAGRQAPRGKTAKADKTIKDTAQAGRRHHNEQEDYGNHEQNGKQEAYAWKEADGGDYPDMADLLNI